MKLNIPYRWLLVILLSGVALLNYLDRQMIATMRPSMQIDIVDLQQATNFGRLMAVFLWVYGAMSAFSGIIADRINRKWLIVGSLFIWSAITFLMGQAQTFDQLYVLRALMGFSEALYIPAGLALIADHHDDKTRSMAIGIHMAGIYLGQALGGFGSTISDAFSWQYAFMFFGCIGMIYSVVLMLVLKKPTPISQLPSPSSQFPTPNSHLPIPISQLLKSFPFWIIVIYFAVPSLPGWAIKNWAPTLIADSLNISMSLAGPLTTISISLSSLAGVVIGGRMSDKWFQRNSRGRIYTGAIGLSLTIPSLLLMGYGDNLFTMVTSAILFGFGFGMFDSNNMPILCQFVPPSLRATGYGFLNTAGIFSGALITNYLGKSTDQGNLGSDFAMLGIVVLVVIAIQLLFLKPQKHV